MKILYLSTCIGVSYWVIHWLRGSQQGTICSPRDIWQSLETFFIVMSEERDATDLLLLFSHYIGLDSGTPWTVACQTSLSSTISQNLLKLMFQWVSDAIQPSPPLSPPSPLAFNLFQHQGLFQWVSFLHQVEKVLELQLQQQSFNEYKGLISFRIDWFHLPAVQGPLKSLLQHHSLKASILQCSDFFMVQLSHLYMTTEKKHSFDYMDISSQSDVSAF